MTLSDYIKASADAVFETFVAPGNPFNAHGLSAKLNVQTATASKVIRYWLAEGLVVDVGLGVKGRRSYRVSEKARRQVELAASADPHENMWRAIRRANRFRASDILGYANARGLVVSLEAVEKYLRFLDRAGYIKIIVHPRGKAEALYQLVRNTGPKAPEMRRLEALYDPNLEDVTYVKGVL